MKTIEADDCLKCLFVDFGTNCGYTHITCRLENDKSCVGDLAGPGSGYCPDHVGPPEWCPLPVKIVPPTKKCTCATNPQACEIHDEFGAVKFQP